MLAYRIGYGYFFKRNQNGKGTYKIKVIWKLKNK